MLFFIIHHSSFITPKCVACQQGGSGCGIVAWRGKHEAVTDKRRRIVIISVRHRWFLKFGAEPVAQLPQTTHGINRHIAGQQQFVTHFACRKAQTCHHGHHIMPRHLVALFGEFANQGSQRRHPRRTEITVQPLHQFALRAAVREFQNGFGQLIYIIGLHGKQRVAHNAQTQIETTAAISQQITQAIFLVFFALLVAPERHRARSRNHDDAGFAFGCAPIRNQVIRFDAVQAGIGQFLQDRLKGMAACLNRVACHTGADSGEGCCRKRNSSGLARAAEGVRKRTT